MLSTLGRGCAGAAIEARKKTGRETQHAASNTHGAGTRGNRGLEGIATDSGGGELSLCLRGLWRLLPMPHRSFAEWLRFVSSGAENEFVAPNCGAGILPAKCGGTNQPANAVPYAPREKQKLSVSGGKRLHGAWCTAVGMRAISTLPASGHRNREGSLFRSDPALRRRIAAQRERTAHAGRVPYACGGDAAPGNRSALGKML